MYLELWEVGAGMAARGGAVPEELASWLAALYATPAPRPELFDAYLHDFPAVERAEVTTAASVEALARYRTLIFA